MDHFHGKYKVNVLPQKLQEKKKVHQKASKTHPQKRYHTQMVLSDFFKFLKDGIISLLFKLHQGMKNKSFTTYYMMLFFWCYYFAYTNIWQKHKRKITSQFHSQIQMESSHVNPSNRRFKKTRYGMVCSKVVRD